MHDAILKQIKAYAELTESLGWTKLIDEFHYRETLLREQIEEISSDIMIPETERLKKRIAAERQLRDHLLFMEKLAEPFASVEEEYSDLISENPLFVKASAYVHFDAERMVLIYRENSSEENEKQ